MIERIAPERAGVLLLRAADGRWIYVGEAGNLRARLLELFEGDNDCVARESPTDFAFELIATPEQRSSRQRLLDQELAPVC